MRYKVKKKQTMTLKIEAEENNIERKELQTSSEKANEFVVPKRPTNQRDTNLCNGVSAERTRQTLAKGRDCVVVGVGQSSQEGGMEWKNFGNGNTFLFSFFRFLFIFPISLPFIYFLRYFYSHFGFVYSFS